MKRVAKLLGFRIYFFHKKKVGMLKKRPIFDEKVPSTRKKNVEMEFLFSSKEIYFYDGNAILGFCLKFRLNSGMWSTRETT